MGAENKNSLLIVDDDSSNLIVLSHILQSNYTIYTARNGISAIKKAKKFFPDLILLDILMPGMDGYEVFSALQQSDSVKQIPVMFITELNSFEDEKRGLKLGAVDYINKPFDDMVVKLRVDLQLRLIDQLKTIEHLSRTDHLTKLPNRRVFDTRLREEWGRMTREKKPLTLMMVDIDYFKHYNDTYGHLHGDIALQYVALCLKQMSRRSSDFAARWGGEEFAMLLPNTDAQSGLKVAEDLRKTVEYTEIPLSDSTITKVTVSIGVNSQIPARNGKLNEFTLYADKALYAAKEAGRNRVCLYDAGPKHLAG
jgi:diguanylate cyclase (GGDEF)-like protein